MTDVLKIKREIIRRIRDYENTAEEYFQEIEDEVQGNINLARSQSLSELLEWIKLQQTYKNISYEK